MCTLPRLMSPFLPPLPQFKSLYPEVYRAKFPEEEEPQKPEGKSRMKSLIKLASLTSLGRSRQMRV